MGWKITVDREGQQKFRETVNRGLVLKEQIKKGPSAIQGTPMTYELLCATRIQKASKIQDPKYRVSRMRPGAKREGSLLRN